MTGGSTLPQMKNWISCVQIPRASFGISTACLPTLSHITTKPTTKSSSAMAILSIKMNTGWNGPQKAKAFREKSTPSTGTRRRSQSDATGKIQTLLRVLSKRRHQTLSRRQTIGSLAGRKTQARHRLRFLEARYRSDPGQCRCQRIVSRHYGKRRGSARKTSS